MSRTPPKPSTFHEPSLVPLADMLTNTVGVVVFILVFTVLTAGGAVVAKRLPMVHEVEQTRSVHYLCLQSRLYPLRAALVEQLMKDLGRPDSSKQGFREFAAKINGREVSDEHLRLVLQATYEESATGYRIDLRLVCEPKPEGGLAMSSVASAGAFFQSELATMDSQTTMLIFTVQPDSIATFRKARDLAVSQGFAVNWQPREAAKPVTYTLGGSGDGRKLDAQ